MSQTFQDISPTERLRDSRQKIIDRDEAIRTCFAGESFPAANLAVGQLCLRTDEGKLYQLKGLSPTNWRLIAYLTGTAISREVAQSLFASIGHVHDDRYAAASHSHIGEYAAANHSHSGVLQPYDPDLSAFAALTTTGLVKRTGDGQAATIASTAAGEALLTAASVTAQRTALGLSDAATTSVADIRAGVSVTDKVSKAGDTMTGQLNGTVFKSTGTAATTGFKVADGTDLAAIFKAANYTALQSATTSASGDGVGNYTSVSLGSSGTQVILYTTKNCNCNCMG